ncbi:YadA-like family protein [uncultured Haemophilus sp.]|uniref:YadA-like family protein n=1 Tax=uncultured Haemophilus sp. TaxID=237779 RepID=UPI002588D661|nr:YadA-like family protein [uncultured Haemophilus sp.]
MKKTILALTIATLSIGAYANTYDADKTNYAATTSQNPNAVAHAKAMVNITTNGEAKVYASDATAYGDSRTYAGYRGTATGANTVANGEASVATGYSSTASGIASIAHGNDAKATGDGSIAIGAEVSSEGYRATAVGRGANGKGAGATALGSAAQATGTSSVALGSAATASDTRSVAVGANANADGHRATALGTNTKASGPGAVALGNESEAVNQKLWNRTNESAVIDGVTLNGWAGTKTMGEVSVGTKDKERAISNVAAAEISETSTEAVNGSQLYSAVKKVAENKQAISDNKQAIVTNAKNIDANASQISVNRAKIDKLSNGINGIAQANKRIDSLSDDVRKHRKLASAGIASAFAVANIPHATYAGKSALGVGVGGHGGQQALAVRYSRLSDNTKWLVSASGSVDTQSQVTYGAGLTYQF